MLKDHCSYIKQKTKTIRTRHEGMSIPDSYSGTMSVLPVITVVSSRLAALDCAIWQKSCYDFCSVDPKRKYLYVQDLKKGLAVSSAMYTASLSLKDSSGCITWSSYCREHGHNWPGQAVCQHTIHKIQEESSWTDSGSLQVGWSPMCFGRFTLSWQVGVCLCVCVM